MKKPQADELWRRTLLKGTDAVARRTRGPILRLAKELAPKNIRQACKDIEGHLVTYQLLLRHDTLQEGDSSSPTAPQPPEVRAYLKSLIAALAQARSQLQRLDDASELEIKFGYEVGKKFSLSSDIAAVNRLWLASKRALEGLRRGGGTKGRPSLSAIVQWLAEVYERETGKRFSVGRERESESFNVAARWVARVARVVSPDLPDAALLKAFRSVKRNKALPDT